MKSLLFYVVAALIYVGLSGCSAKSSDELSTGEIEAIFEIYISKREGFTESDIEIEAAMKTTNSEGDISFVSLSENDSLTVTFKDIEKNIIENYMARGLYSTVFREPVLDNDSMDIEFIHNDQSIVSSLNFGVLPELTSEDEFLLSINDSLPLSWINNSAKMNNIYITGTCYKFKVIEVGLEESSYVLDLDELELRDFSDTNTCSSEVELEWKVSGDFNSEFDTGEITAYISKLVIFNIEQ